MKPKKQINIDIGARVKQAREEAGLTQDTFAEMIGLGVKHISAIECGAVGLSLTSLQTICNALAISSDALLFGDVVKNDVESLSRKLERLPQPEYKIVKDVVGKLLEAFALHKNKGDGTGTA